MYASNKTPHTETASKDNLRGNVKGQLLVVICGQYAPLTSACVTFMYGKQ
jgi:hypothetical protein